MILSISVKEIEVLLQFLNTFEADMHKEQFSKPRSILV